ncbi:MAG: hypothetical protein PSV13_09075 [Lacunisphaera sp.]|nr:hypothetical protein [Lacunisphaera sp.]
MAYHDEGFATLPADIKPGQYIVALAPLDRQGGMMPSARSDTENCFRGGWQPLGFIGVGADGPRIVAKQESIPLTDQWQEHSLEFEISTPFQDQTFLRFRLPREGKGTFDLTAARRKVAQ